MRKILITLYPDQSTDLVFDNKTFQENEGNVKWLMGQAAGYVLAGKDGVLVDMHNYVAGSVVHVAAEH